jgi:predicted Zn-dependent peptidase
MPPTTSRVDRSQLPRPEASRLIAFPAIERSTLGNGMGVWTIRDPQVPIVALSVLVRSGSAGDPRAQHGLAALTADMLDEGSGDRSAIEMHEAIGRLGAHLETDIGADALSIGFSVLSRFAEPALMLLGDIVARPSLRESDFDRVRTLRLHRLTQIRDVPTAIADRAFVRSVFGLDHPYGHTPIGDQAAVASLAAGDVRRFHADSMSPAAATLIAVGDCEHASIRQFAERAFGDWPSSSAPAAAGTSAGTALLPPPALYVVVRPGAAQSELRIGHVSAPRNTPDYHALISANMVLGGQFTSRLNLKLREEKGVTYGARTAFDFRLRPGPFVLQVGVETGATAESIEDSIREIREVRGARPVTVDELQLATAGLTRGYARNFETADQIGRALIQLALYDLPDSYFSEFVPNIERLTPADVMEAFARAVNPEGASIVVVGDWDRVRADVERLGLGDAIILPPDAV